MNKKSVHTIFSKAIFWDAAQVSLDKHKEFIISRVLNEGLTSDIKALWKLYPEKDIKHVVKNRKNLNARTAYFWCSYFNIPFEKCKSLNKLSHKI